jgi:hypothetical protein
VWRWRRLLCSKEATRKIWVVRVLQCPGEVDHGTENGDRQKWLNGSTEEALNLAREYPPDRMRIVQEAFFKEDRFDIAA